MTSPALIYYQDSVSCLSCWGDNSSPLSSTLPNHSLLLDSGKEPHEKKVSLKKYNHSRLKRSEFKIPITSPLILETYSNTTRVYQTKSTETTRLETPIKTAILLDVRPVSHPQWYSFPHPSPPPLYPQEEMERRLAVSASGSRPLTKTTKLDRMMPTKSQELKKTKKTTPFHRIFQLSELKESVCSFTENFGDEAKLEESQILMDYFHPTEKRMSEMEEYMKSKGQQSSQSAHSKQ